MKNFGSGTIISIDVKSSWRKRGNHSCLVHVETSSRHSTHTIITTRTNGLRIVAFTLLCVFVYSSLFILIAGWVHRCNYSTGQCRTACKENEKEKEKCIGKRICCIPLIKPKSSSILKKQEMTRKTMASTTILLRLERKECQQTITSK